MESLETINEIYRKYNEVNDQIKTRLEELWSCGKDEFKFGDFEGDVDDFEFSDDNQNIIIQWYETWAYGGYEYGKVKLPIDLLWNDYRPYFENMKKEREDFRKKQEEINKTKSEESQRKLYEELKTKFEK